MEIIKGKAPLEFEDITKLIGNDKLKYIVEYSKSEVKGKALLVYLTNLDLEVDVELNADEKEEIFEIMEAYFASDISCEIPALDALGMAIILEHKGLDHRFITGELPLTKEDMREFTRSKPENSERVTRCCIFLDSMPLFMQYSIPELDKMLQIEKNFRTIDDKRFFTSNVSTLVGVPGFLDYFLTSEAPAEMYYFDRQFNDYMFRGKNLYYYLVESQSESFAAIVSVLNNNTTLEEINEVREIADELSVG